MSEEWVEILEPESRRKMYANINSGDCRWQPPPNATVKGCHDNQWWELFDARTNRNYYYNVVSQKTSWERPVGGDILPLAKLQTMQEKLQMSEAEQQQQQQQQQTPQRSATLPSQKTPSSTNHGSGGQIPSPPKMPKPTKIYSNDDLLDYKDNLNTHKKGFLIRKKVSIASMLSWSREPIKVPMLTTLGKKDRKDAVDMFRNVQIYMGDRNSRGKDQMQVCVEIVDKCWSTHNLRDELYIQLCKQTFGNRSTNSCEKGWELMLICLTFFPPSSKFLSYLQGYINRTIQGKQSTEICASAEKAMKKLERIEQTGAKRGTKQPTQEEVEHARQAISHPSVFGSSLEDIMESQEATHPDLEIPYVLKVLTEAILKRNGHQTEGIFRVPGDIDAVNMLKVIIDRNERPEGLEDPHVPGSALKLWFRELQEPLIPQELYNSCVDACDDAQRSVQVLDMLPELNRRILMYIIRFLQVVGQPENQKVTKMNNDNLAMVWAPNFLRCPSNDPMVIFQNTKKEMTFVRQLIVHLDTDVVAHL